MKYLLIVVNGLIMLSCKLALKVPEFKTAKTELEEQVLGDWYRVDDDLVLFSTVRSGSSPHGEADPVAMARLNQKFNKDDLEELKNLGVLGEQQDGLIGFVPSQRSGYEGKDPAVQRLARIVLREENEDRQVLWRDRLGKDSAHELTLEQVRATWAASQRKLCKPGQWYQDTENQWLKK